MSSKEDENLCWFHGNISRSEAEQLLQEPDRADGAFLVRESNSSKGDFVLSVLQNNEVCHYQIRRHGEDAFFSIDECTKIHGLDSLIDHYKENFETLLDGPALKQPVKGFPLPHDLRRHGRTNLLHRATSEGSFKIVAELLKVGYQLEAKNQDGQTAVHLASLRGNDDILRELIEHGANVNCRDTAGMTPLHYACQNNFQTTVRLLVQIGGANLQARNTETGFVPLHIAAVNGHKEVIGELLSLNAPVNPRSKEGFVPSHLASKNNHIECVYVLENYKSPTPKTHKSQWYHGTLGRSEAELAIKDYCMESGTYLVRFSNRNNRTILTLLSDTLFFNYIINEEEPFMYIDDGPLLNSLEHVIEYYSFIPDGLPTMLKTPVPPKPKPSVPDCSTMPRSKKKSAISRLANTKLMEYPKTEEFLNNKGYPNEFKNLKFTSTFNLVLKDNNNHKKSDIFISLNKIIIGAEIGAGEFASVYKGKYLKPDGKVEKVAIKTLRNHLEPNTYAFLKEAEVMIKLNHHCIVKLMGLCEAPHFLMVQELMSLGSLLHYLLKNKDEINPNYEFKIWAAQIACGMKYLEDQRFVHRDLAARNILLASKIQAKISDFGLSRALNMGSEYYKAMQGGKWPLKWYAPECYNFGNFTSKGDVWSFGVTLWEMFSFGAIPYGTMKGSEAISLIENGERLDQPEACPDEVYKTMLRCWSYEVEDRPTFEELLTLFDTGYTNIQEMLPLENFV